MKYTLPFALSLALAACGEPPSPQSTEVLELSRAAVSQEPVPEPEPIEETVLAQTTDLALSEPMKADAVPIAQAEPEPEPASLEPMARFELRRGETLDHFARWTGFPVEDIAELSGLDLDGDYPVGTVIELPVSGEALAEIEVRREEHWDKRVEGYLASRGGAISSEFYQVRTGDTAWSIAKEKLGIPIWILEAYNPSASLDTLRPGQELMVPVLADTIVDAEPTPD